MKRRRRRFETTAGEVLEDRALLSASTLDTAFGNAGINDTTGGVELEIQDDGKVLVGSPSGLSRLNTDGTLDTSFGTGGVADLGVEGTVSAIAILPNNQIITLVASGEPGALTSIFRLNADGSVDPTFSLDESLDIGNVGGGFPGAAVDSQGRILLLLEVFNGTAIGRFDQDGALDTTFVSPDVPPGFAAILQFPNGINDFVIEADDSVLVAASSLTRIREDGSTDPNFNVTSTTTFRSVAVSDTGAIYGGGIDPATGLGIVELIDATTGATLATATFADNEVTAISPQIDGRVLVTGGRSGGPFGNPIFGTGDGDAVVRRFEADLTQDLTFGEPVLVVGASLFDLEVDPENRIVVTGLDSDSNFFTGRLTPGNLIPRPVDDAASVTEDAASNLSIGNVIDNDVDLNPEDTLTVSEVGGDPADVGATLTLAYGTVVVNSDGSYTYTLDNSNAAVQALNTGQVLTETVSYTVNDEIGEVATANLTITINGLDEEGPVELVNGELIVTGSSDSDSVTVTANNGVITVTYSGLPDQTFNESDVESIAVSLGDGDDSIRVDFIDVPAIINGGAGDDFLEGSRGGDLFDGGSGNDTLEGFSGNDTLIGGLGDDWILGGTGDDLLLGGLGSDTLFGQSGSDVIQGGGGNDGLSGGSGGDLLVGGTGGDAINAGSGGDLLFGGQVLLSSLDLRLILNEFTSDRDYATRVNNIRTGSGPILNGVRLINGVNVLDDNARDLLFGNSGRDWYVASPGDVLFGRSFFEELDVI